MSYTNQKQGIGSLQLDESEYLASCLDIFSQPKIETQLIRGKDIIAGTLNSVQDGGPFEINIKSSFNSYIFIPATKLHGCFQVVKINEDKGLKKMPLVLMTIGM